MLKRKMFRDCRQFKAIETERQFPPCDAMKDGFICSRKKGHKGKHHAHSFEYCCKVY